MLTWLGTACGTGPYAGYYDPNTKAVYVCEVKYTDISTSMLQNHEIAHYIQDNLLMEKEWTDYQKEWEKSKAKGKTQFIRDYGMTNAKEWFAEDAMYLEEWQYKNSRDPQVRKRIAIVRKALNRMK